MKVGVIGAGTMGQGIAKAFAQVEGYEVALCDIKQEWAEGGKEKIKKGYARLVEKGKMTQEAVDGILAKITPGLKEDLCKDCDLIVEAAFENMEVKKTTFKELDEIAKPAIGNEYTLSTCQLDFCLPAKFNLSYIDSDGTKKTPVVLHRAILGSLDRFMAYILEETKGNLPLWLAPVQAKILPVKNEDEELNAYSHDLYKYLDDNGIRVEIDERNEKLGYRIREAQMEKVPYLLVLGKNEAADGTVSYRLHGEQNSTTVSKEDFLALLKEDIRTKKINPAALK